MTSLPKNAATVREPNDPLALRSSDLTRRVASATTAAVFASELPHFKTRLLLRRASADRPEKDLYPVSKVEAISDFSRSRVSLITRPDCAQ